MKYPCEFDSESTNWFTRQSSYADAEANKTGSAPKTIMSVEEEVWHIRVYSACPDLSSQKLRIITVGMS